MFGVLIFLPHLSDATSKPAEDASYSWKKQAVDDGDWELVQQAGS